MGANEIITASKYRMRVLGTMLEGARQYLIMRKTTVGNTSTDSGTKIKTRLINDRVRAS